MKANNDAAQNRATILSGLSGQVDEIGELD